MLLFVILSAVVSASANTGFLNYTSDRYTTVFRKCCPRSQALVKIIKFDTDYSEKYECINSDSAENIYNISLPPLIIIGDVDVQHGFPMDCANLQMIQHTDVEFDLLVMENKCYDRLVAEIVNGTLKENIPQTVTLTCYQTETDFNYSSNLNIDRLRKCCPRGQMYDLTYRMCRDADEESDEEWLLNQLQAEGNYIYEVEAGLSCKFDEYAVDLHSRNFLFNIDGSVLYTMKRDGKDRSRLMQGQWCVEREHGGEGLIAQVCTRDCSAYGAFCVRKCCPPGHYFKIRSCGNAASDCTPYTDEEVFFNMSLYFDPLLEKNEHLMDTMGLRIGLQCPEGRYVLNRSLEQDKHRLNEQGLIEIETFPEVPTNGYCLEVFDRRGCYEHDILKSPVLCFIREEAKKDFRFSFVVITISCICLGLTLVVYVSIPELRNLHGRNLICHVSMMLLAYSCLARVQYDNVDDIPLCTFLGYAIYFGFTAAFSWLHVMCFDIWWTFGSVRTVQPLRKASSERRRFIWYSIYAWSIAILMTTTTYLLDRYPVSSHLDSNIGISACWFGTIQNADTDWPHYILFVIPMGIFTCSNFILWLLTARHCAQIKSEVHRLQAGSVGDRAKKRFRIDRAKYILTGKLWVVMGAGWASEMLSTIFQQPPWLWNVVDLINELQGVFIFLILVVKPKLYYLIRKRLGLSRMPTDPRLEKPDPQKNGTASSGRTSSTFLSRTISSDERAHLKISPGPKHV